MRMFQLIVLVCATLHSFPPVLARSSQQGPKLVGTVAAVNAAPALLQPGLRFESYDGTSFTSMADGGVQTHQNGSSVDTGETYEAAGGYPNIMADESRNLFLLHPGTFSSARVRASLGYSITTAGRFAITGAFARANDAYAAGDGVRVFVLKNSTQVFVADISSQLVVKNSDPFAGTGGAPFSLTVDAVAGDIVRFVVSSGAQLTDGTFDATALRFTVSAPSQPDLLAQSVLLSSTSLTTGGSVTVTANVKNQGSGNAAATTTMIRLNNNSGSSSPSDSIQQGVSTPAITAGISATVSATFTLDTAGIYYAHVYVDNNAVLSQSNLGNDTYHSGTITVTAGQVVRRRTAIPPGNSVSESTTQLISSAIGGTMTLAKEGLVVTFVPRTFMSDQSVTLRADPISDEDAFLYGEAEGILDAGPSTRRVISIETGGQTPLADITVAATVSDTLLAQIGATRAPVILVENYSFDDTESEEAFDPIDSSYDASAKRITATIPAWAFTDQRTESGSIQAAFTLGSLFLGNVGAPAKSVFKPGTKQSTVCYPLRPSACFAPPSGYESPLLGIRMDELTISSPYGPRRGGGGSGNHDGVDVLSCNDAVQSMVTGWIAKIGFSPSTGQVLGIGFDGTDNQEHLLLYEHLKPSSILARGLVPCVHYPCSSTPVPNPKWNILAGCPTIPKNVGVQCGYYQSFPRNMFPVAPGQQIGITDSSGWLTGNKAGDGVPCHLHIELGNAKIGRLLGIPNDKPHVGRIDPIECGIITPVKLTLATAGTGTGLIALQVESQPEVTCGPGTFNIGKGLHVSLIALEDFATNSSFTGWTVEGSGNPACFFPFCALPRITGDTVATVMFTKPSSFPTCTSFQINPPSASPTSAAGSQIVTATGSPAGCESGNWSASGNGSWLTVSPPPSGGGSGSTTVSWAQNTSTSSRLDHATIAGHTFSVMQAGASSPTCTSFGISPSSTPAAATAGSQSVTVTGSPSGCQGGNWSASGNGSWLSVSPTNGSGSGSTTVSWAQNTSTSSRSDHATIAGIAFSVTQTGASATGSVAVTNVQLSPCTSLATPLPGWKNCMGTVSLSITKTISSGFVSVNFNYPDGGAFYHGQLQVGSGIPGIVTVNVVNNYISHCVTSFATTVDVHNGPESAATAPLLISQPITLNVTCN